MASAGGLIRSVFETSTTDTDLTFVLTSGGHNACVVREPGHLPNIRNQLHDFLQKLFQVVCGDASRYHDRAV